MIHSNYKAIEDFLTDETFLNFYFNKNEPDVLDWKDWLDDNPKQAMPVQEAFMLLDKLSLKWSEQQIKEKFIKLSNQISAVSHQPSADIQNPKSETRNPKFNVRWWAAAASVLVIFSSSLYIYYQTKNTVVSPEATSMKILENPRPNDANVYYLSDGSVVRLNSKSQLRIADDYGINTRDIYLVGEAYFEVAKDATKPFRVYAGGTVTTAIGTAFNVRAYSHEKEVKVSLVEGKVTVKQKEKEDAKSSSVELVQGQQVRLLTETQSLSAIENFKPQITTAWKEDGYIQLENTPLKDVLDMLKSFYAVRFDVKDAALLQQSLSGTISRKMTLTETLDILSFANHFEYRIEKNQTVIIFK